MQSYKSTDSGLPILPNFLVIGVEKGGTTWLHTQLKKHPDIYLPHTKEVHFFNSRNSNLKEKDHFSLGIDWYADFFKDYRGEKAVGEVTPMYICDEDAPRRIKDTLPGVKLLVMLRDPVSRAYSHYWMAKNKNLTTLSFQEVIDQKEARFIERGLYYRQLAAYYALFDPAQIMVVFYEEVFADPRAWLTRICEFLGVDSSIYGDDDTVFEKVFQASSYRSVSLLKAQSAVIQKLRKSRRFGRILNYVKRTGVSDIIKSINKVDSKYEKMSDEDRRQLAGYYAEDLRRLKDLLNRELPFPS
jgi:hypothetical protein